MFTNTSWPWCQIAHCDYSSSLRFNVSQCETDWIFLGEMISSHVCGGRKQVFKAKPSGFWGRSLTRALSGNKVEDFKHEEMKSWNMSEVYRWSRKTRDADRVLLCIQAHVEAFKLNVDLVCVCWTFRNTIRMQTGRQLQAAAGRRDGRQAADLHWDPDGKHRAAGRRPPVVFM